MSNIIRRGLCVKLNKGEGYVSNLIRGVVCVEFNNGGGVCIEFVEKITCFKCFINLGMSGRLRISNL